MLDNPHHQTQVESLLSTDLVAPDQHPLCSSLAHQPLEVNTGATLWSNTESGERCEECCSLTGNDTITQRCRGDRGSYGWTIGRHQDRLGEVQEEVEELLIVVSDQCVEGPGVH